MTETTPTHDDGDERTIDRRSGRPSAADRSPTRRQFIAGGIAAATAAVAGCNSGGQTEHGWIDVQTPTNEGLNAAAMTTNGPYAVGESGLVLARRGDEWRIVVERGPSGASNGLTGADATDDGRALWVCGSSGALGRYDVTEGEMTDFTAPNGKTSSWVDVAVARTGGTERVYVVNSSGELLPGRRTRRRVKWGEVVKPTGGESASAVDVAGAVAYVADTGGGVYRNDTGSRTGWKTIGIRGADATLHDVAAVDADLVNAAADDGSIYVYNGYNWLQLHAGEKALHAVDRDRHRGLAVGTGGTVHAIEGNNWQTEETPTERVLRGCALGTSSYADVAVGTEGLVLERFG